MKLGPLQRKWVNTLKKHPERQLEGQLGEAYEDESIYKCCCLGQAGLLLGTCSFERGVLRETFSNGSYTLRDTYRQLGLRSEEGAILESHLTLTSLNDDHHHTWVDIAYLIEAAPELFFTESV